MFFSALLFVSQHANLQNIELTDRIFMSRQDYLGEEEELVVNLKKN